MPFCSPDKITVPPNRYRPAESPEVQAMCDSMKEVGQLQPILVDKDMNLTVGLHRLEACRKLGRDVWYETEDEGRLMLVNPLLRRVAEYQENFRRTDFTPEQKNRAIADIDRLMREIHGSKVASPGSSNDEGWTQTDTAKKLGLKSHRTVSDAIKITKAIELGVEGVAKAKTTQEALSIVKTVTKLGAAQELAKRRAAEGATTEIEDPMEYFSEKILLGDCLEKLKALPSRICSMFITDPPWKIGADKVVQERSGSQKATGGYDDSDEAIIQLVKDVAKEMYRVAKPDCHVVMFCGARYWWELVEHFRSIGFQVYNKPLVWVKAGSNGPCSSKSPAPSIWPASITDFMLFARKGNPILAQLHKGDAFICLPCAREDRIHQAQKPIQLMEEIISRFYHEGTNPLLIDPFVGSGSTLVAARRLGIKNYFGYELDENNRKRAIAFLVNKYMEEQEREQKERPTMDTEDFD